VVRRGAIFALAGAGFLLAAAVVVSWGRLGPEPGSRNPTRWLGLLAVLAPDDASKAHLLALLVPALILFMACWCVLLRLAFQRRLDTRASALVAACWALPFTVGPIIGSRDAYAYVAQGELARRGFDPTRSVVSQLGSGPLLAAVDPRWRETRPPYGGVAVAIQKGAAAAGSPVAGLVALRIVAVVAVVVLVVVTARMAFAAQRPLLIAAIAANPLVLLHLVAGAHLDAVAAALLVCGLALARGQAPDGWRHVCGVMLCTLGAMVKLPVGLGAAFLLVCGVVAAGPALRARLRSAAADVLAAIAAVGISVLISGAGLGWLRNFGTPGKLRTGIAPADLGQKLLSGLARLVGLHPDPSSVLDVTRLLAAAAGALIAVLVVLPRRARTGDGNRGWTAPTLDGLGLGLLALALLGPVLYPWYLAPALPLLALTAGRSPAAEPSALLRGRPSPGAARAIILVSSVVLTFATVPSLGPVWHSF
jgi:alpha-1,6-mannosyltransferase